MTFLSSISINFKKLQKRFGKASFLIIPIGFLVALSIIISSQIANFKQASDQAIFAAVADQGTIIQVAKEQPARGSNNRPAGDFFDQNTTFTDSDVASIEQTSNVISAIINYTLPINTIITKDLAPGSTVDLTNLTVLNSQMAGLFTKESFNYQPGQNEIPIILNANTLQETYEDWKGQTSISVTMQRQPRGSSQNTANSSAASNFRDQLPVKTKALSYNKDELLGKTFEIQFGGLDTIADYKNEFTNGQITFTKLTDAEVATKQNDQKTAISQYWNYDAISKPISYKFKVVGFIQSDSNRSTYIPENFAQTLLKDVITNQLTARNSNPISATDLSTKFKGLTYNGLNLQNNSTVRGPAGTTQMPRFNPQNSSQNATQTTTSYTIPGLVLEVDGNNSNEVKGEYKDANLFENSAKIGNTISVKINSIFNRQQVVADLNSKGYAYQDANNFGVFQTIQNNINTISFSLIVGFVILSSLIILFFMSKSVAESKKEIGIFRAVGFTKINILTIFITQGLLYTLLGYALGLMLGLLGNLVASKFVANWFESFVKQTITETFNLTPTVDYSIFNHFDISTFAFLSAILFIISILVATFFSLKAANTSPVEAIKSE